MTAPEVTSTSDPIVVIPNWNGKEGLADCINSLMRQSLKPHIVIVDNGSTDGSVEFIEEYYPEIELIKHSRNKGYAGGVNPGLRRAIELNANYVAPFNNDAVADPDWLAQLASCLDNNPGVGAAACKILSQDGNHMDSTGDYYTGWGLPYPRGRDELASDKYDRETSIFAASGGASLYRVSMLKEVGLLDEDFFAYYEDVDLSFRAQLAGWKVAYVPTAIVRHATSTTGSKIKGFFTYQTQKNLPMLLIKNVPRGLFFKVWLRFSVVYLSFFLSATARGQLWYALKGWLRMLSLLPKKLGERRRIQKGRKVSVEYIRDQIVWDLPPNAARLRTLRAKWWRLTRRQVV